MELLFLDDTDNFETKMKYVSGLLQLRLAADKIINIINNGIVAADIVDEFQKIEPFKTATDTKKYLDAGKTFDSNSALEAFNRSVIA